MTTWAEIPQTHLIIAMEMEVFSTYLGTWVLKHAAKQIQETQNASSMSGSVGGPPRSLSAAQKHSAQSCRPHPHTLLAGKPCAWMKGPNPPNAFAVPALGPGYGPSSHPSPWLLICFRESQDIHGLKWAFVGKPLVMGKNP